MEEISKAILDYVKALNELKRLKVIKNQKDFTSQLGEWIASIIYGGNLAISGKQEDWDLEVNGTKYQIKTHAKAYSTKRENTDFKYSKGSKIDFIVIIVFDENYKIKKIYKLPFNDAHELVNKDRKELVIKWKDLEEKFTENIDEIVLKNEILTIFKN